MLPRAGRVGGGPADPFPSRAIEGNQATSGNGSPVIGQQGLVVRGPSPIRPARDATRSIAGERSGIIRARRLSGVRGLTLSFLQGVVTAAPVCS